MNKNGIPEGWREPELRDVSGYSNNKVETSSVNLYNYISTENMLPDIGGITKAVKLPSSKNVNSYKPKDILISNIRTYFKKIWFAKFSGGASSDVLIVRIKTEEINSLYLYYSLANNLFFDYTSKTSKGTKMPRGDKKAIMKYKINLPPLPEQKKIAEILSSLDDKIELNNQINKNLENMAQTIFKQWFVDFEFPDENGNPYASSGGEFVESEMGLIPEGWQASKSNEIFNINIGKTPPRKEKEWFSLNNKDIKWLSIKDLGKSGMFIFNTSEYLTKKATEKFNVKVVPKNTIVLSFKLTVGRIGITSEAMATNEAIAHFNIKDNKEMTKEFIYLYLKSFNFESLGSTSSIATAVNSKIIKSMPILLPKNKVINDFSNIISNIFEKIHTKQKETQLLIKTRDSLLPKLMSGEIRVGDLEG